MTVTTEDALKFIDHAMRNWPLNGMGILTDDLEDLRLALEQRDARLRREAREAMRDDAAKMREMLCEAVVLLDNGNGIADAARYSFVERAVTLIRAFATDAQGEAK